ncbi:hypothetical protein CJF42_14680 [Pseudoalteromonas sp. NBT06-2]|uniref:DUF4920 domain-containing protein n=1 Tax=Pseudoalteromonas sp. NBT06-2 TaxID=2025950 RepID=UPI000BA7A313|nr:DUF4920 domain-containing protein [Pseudoalteromonas sp. NBT06-2]PAJ73658.1 hypothetical protein CJF42_14680 [Pseudoalteromonas sp. NBT06-2]
MGNCFKLSLIIGCSLIFTSHVYSKEINGGADMSKLTSISTILTKPENYYKNPTTITGTVVKVCQKRGCWMQLATDKSYDTLTIKVPDGEMVFPMTAMGKTVYATGTLKAIEMTLEQTNIRLERQDKPTVEKPMTFYRFSPTGVTIVD